MKRIAYIDFLKVVGLFGIILAHVGSPQWVMQLRNFDVPLMVILSAILAKQTFPKESLNARAGWKYIIKRVKRLVLPTWIFLVFYFLLRAMTGDIQIPRYYVDSFLLTRYGVGYVWIVLIYLYCAIWVPLFAKAKYGKKLWLVAAAIYLIYELAYCFGLGVENRLIMSTFYYIIPYGCLALLGFFYDEMSKNVKRSICGVFAVLFILLCVLYAIPSGQFQLVQIAKYPPRLYYNAYALAVSFGLLLLCEGKAYKLFHSPFIRFFSSHSFWIYLWHVLYLWIFADLIQVTGWIPQFVLVTICSAITVWIQSNIIGLLKRKTGKTFLKYLQG